MYITLGAVMHRYEFSDSIVASIPACHAGDRGSIPRQRDILYFGLATFLSSFFAICITLESNHRHQHQNITTSCSQLASPNFYHTFPVFVMLLNQSTLKRHILYNSIVFTSMELFIIYINLSVNVDFFVHFLV